MIDWHLFLKTLGILIGIINFFAMIRYAYLENEKKVFFAFIIGIISTAIGVAIQ